MKVAFHIVGLLGGLALAGCSENESAPEPVAKSPPTQQAAPENAQPDLLIGTWELREVSSRPSVAGTVTVEFTRAGDMITREEKEVVSRGKFVIEEDKKLKVTTIDGAKDEPEIAMITRLTNTDLELTQLSDSVKLTFKRHP